MLIFTLIIFIFALIFNSLFVSSNVNNNITGVDIVRTFIIMIITFLILFTFIEIENEKKIDIMINKNVIEYNVDKQTGEIYYTITDSSNSWVFEVFDIKNKNDINK